MRPVVRGTRSLAYSASDRGSGVRRVSLQANGAELASDVRNCKLANGFTTALVPCRATVSGSWPVNTAASAFATGPNQVGACAADLALDGTPNRHCSTQRVWIDNVCPASTVAGASVTARFANGRQRIALPSNRSARVEGLVRGAEGEPVQGATVCALTRVALEGAPVVRAMTASTNDAGRYRLALPRGASRHVFVHYVTGSKVIARHGLAVRSQVRPTLSVSPTQGLSNGDSLRFTGRLPGPACSQRVVKVQAKVRERWQVFRTDRTSRQCRFATGYRLRATTDGTRYRFRALVPPQDGYPYERGHTRSVTVSVNG
jgi:hypothetical protein